MVSFDSLQKIKDANEQSFFIGQNSPIPAEFEGRFEILEELGAGGMGVVYKARQPALKKMYAIKMLHSVHGQETLLRFGNEAKAISRLQHPNLITSHDFGVVADGRPYMVMDFIEGNSLAEIITLERRLPVSHMLDISIQIARGMAYAHAQGVLHRDLKPGNIMLVMQHDGTKLVKIIDFGIAKVLEGNQPLNLTRTGDVFGSPLYMSPEQAVGRGIDERSDIYSLGCVMYEMLTGVPPFRGASAFETLSLHMNGQAPTLRSNAARVDFPAPLEKLIAKSIAKSQADRWQSMAELERELIAIKKVMESPHRGLMNLVDFDVAKNPIKVKKWHGIAAGAAACTALIAGIIFWPSAQPAVKQKIETVEAQSVESQTFRDPNEMAKSFIVNNNREHVSLEAMDCTDAALEYFKQRNNIKELDLAGTSITGDGLQNIAHLPLRELQLAQTGVSDEALKTVASIKSIELLDLDNTLVKSGGLKYLASMPNLKELRLKNDDLDDAAIDAVINIPKLERLSIGQNCDLTDAGIAKLASLKNLKMLWLSDLNIGDSGVKTFTALKHLKTLDLNRSHVTDNTVKLLCAELPLTDFYLNGTPVSNEAIPAFEKCKTLKHISLSGCNEISTRGCRYLREALPECKVDHGERNGFKAPAPRPHTFLR